MVDNQNLDVLGSVASVRSGFAFKSGDMGKVGVPIIKIKNIVPPTVDTADCERVPNDVISSIPNVDRYAIDEGDILIAMTGATVGKVGRFPPTKERFYLNQRVGKVFLTDAAKADYRYLYYVLSQGVYVQKMFGAADGSAQANISGSQIERLEIPLPSRDTQHAIAHILGTLDDNIELNRRMNETLEAIARAIFKSWFVDFDPVRAKASGEPPESICRRLGLTPELLALFPDRLVDSELGEIPEGWEATKIEVATSKIFSGGTPDTRKAEYWDGDLNWCSSGETRNRFIIETERKITQSGVVNSSTKAVVPGDILIASAGQGHTRGQTAYCAIDTFINQSVVSVRTNTEKAQPHWLFYNLASRYEEMRGLSDSHSSRGSLTTKLIGGMSLILSTIKLVKAFDGIVGPLAEQQIKATQQSITLAAIRDTLLPKLLTGEPPVQDDKTSDAMKGVAYG